MNLTLVVMAAGIGSRFGGLKQITPVDEYGNFIIDYSVNDAIKAGFNHVVFVIKEENLDDFKDTIGKRIENKIKVDYAFQKIEDIPYDQKIAKKRVKPWGTVQAILASRPFVTGNFAVINADDFYGFDTYQKIADFFKENKGAYNYVSVPFPFKETMSNSGAVKRGVCDIKDGIVTKILECSILKEEDHAKATPLNGNESFNIPLDALVSMNIFGFTEDFYELLDEYFKDYFKQTEEEILNGECLLPDCLEKYISLNKIKVHVRPTSSKWLGMTYQEDLDIVKEELKALTSDGKYKKGLW